jgi:DNA modification methylase
MPKNGDKPGCWRAIKTTCQKLIDADMLIVKKNERTGQWKIFQKQYAAYAFDKKLCKLVPIVRTIPIRSILYGDKYPTNLRSNIEIKEIFGDSVFSYAKPTVLIKNLITLISNEGDTILDIFAGSGTTGVAAFQTNRNFILIQLDEANIPDLIKTRLDKQVGSENYSEETK